MTKKNSAVVLLALAANLLFGWTSSQATMLTQAASMDSYFSSLSPTTDEGHSGAVTIGGPADIWTAVEFTSSAPAGATVTDFYVVFDIQQNITTGITTSLNIWALGGPWSENSSRNDISGYSHIPEGSVTLTTGLLPSDGDNSITLSGPTLTALYASGQLASGIFWQDNDLASVFPNGATAYSNNTSLGEVGYLTYQIPEPSTWAMILVACVLLFLLGRCHPATHA